MYRPLSWADTPSCQRRGAFKEPAMAPTGLTNTDRLLPRFYFHIILISKGLPGHISILPGMKDNWEEEDEEEYEDDEDMGRSLKRAVRKKIYIYIYLLALLS